MFDEKNIVHFKYLSILLRNVLPIGKFTNLLIFTKYYWKAGFDDYCSTICNTIQNFSVLNKNISLNYLSQVKLKNDRKCKVNACHKLKKYITCNDYKSISNNIVIKTVDVVSNILVDKNVNKVSNNLCGDMSLAIVDSNTTFTNQRQGAEL